MTDSNDDKKQPVTLVFPSKTKSTTQSHTYHIKADEWETSGAEVDITINSDGSITDTKPSGNA